MGARAGLFGPRALAPAASREHCHVGQRFHVPVNVRRIRETVAAVLDSTSTNPGLLTLEVTESVFVRDEQRALVVLGELKKIGVNLALDDFGTGYSSLGYLNTLPVDTIKVDQTFVSKVDHEPGSQIIVAAIIQLAHSLGMTVVSEGVETAEQHHELTKLGSDSFQGFYFAKPMRASKLDAVIQQRAEGTDPQTPALIVA